MSLPGDKFHVQAAVDHEANCVFRQRECESVRSAEGWTVFLDEHVYIGVSISAESARARPKNRGQDARGDHRHEPPPFVVLICQTNGPFSGRRR